MSRRDKEKLAVSPVSHFLCVAELRDFWQEAAPLVLFSHRRLKNARSVSGRFTGSCRGRSEWHPLGAHRAQPAAYFPTDCAIFSRRTTF